MIGRAAIENPDIFLTNFNRGKLISPKNSWSARLKQNLIQHPTTANNLNTLKGYYPDIGL